MKLISEIKPSIMLNCSLSEAMDKIMNALSSDKHIVSRNRDNDNQEIRVVWNLKINKYLDVINHFFGEDSGVLIRYSFIESETGKTLVTAACSRMNGKQDFLEAGGMYEKIMRKPFEDLK